MTRSNQPPSLDRLISLLYEGDHEETVTCLKRLGTVDVEARKQALQALRKQAQECPGNFDELTAPLSTFLTDEERPVRLAAAKLFVTLSELEPAVVLPVVDLLAERLADDDEFYYVRARCAETLGYVALEFPEAVSDPEILADFRIGLSLDKPEVKEKLAKALEYVALGDPSRLGHQVSSLATHLDDENELVRYHLCTALVVVGCENPRKLTAIEDVLRAQLIDENPYVQGRVMEALGLLVKGGFEVRPTPDLDGIDAGNDETPSFLTARFCFLRQQLDNAQSVAAPEGVGTIESIRDETDDVVEEITSPNGECTNCGLALPDSGPSICPQCGIPR